MLGTRFISLEGLGTFRDKVLASHIDGLDSATPVPAGTLAKSYVVYYIKSGDIYTVANPQPTADTAIPENTYYIIDEGSPDDVTRAPSVQAVVQYIDNVIEDDIGPEIDKRVSSVVFDANTKKLYYVNGGQHEVTGLTFGDNAFNSTAIPTVYLKSASTSGSTLTLTKQDDTTVTFTDTDTTYTFAEGSTDGAFSVTPSGGSAQSVSIHGLGSAAFENSSQFLAAGGKAVDADHADTTEWTGVSGAPTKLSDFTDDLGNSPTHTHSQYSTTDTKNTAGATAQSTATKLYLIGATAQTANPQTYTNAKAYINADGQLVSDGLTLSSSVLATQTWVTNEISTAIGAAIAASY